MFLPVFIMLKNFLCKVAQNTRGKELSFSMHCFSGILSPVRQGNIVGSVTCRKDRLTFLISASLMQPIAWRGQLRR